MTTIHSLTSEKKKRLLDAVLLVLEAFGYEMSDLEKVRGARHVKPVRNELLSLTLASTTLREAQSALFAIRIHLSRKRSGNPVLIGRANVRMKDLGKDLASASPKDRPGTLPAGPSRVTDLEKVTRREALNWKPASQYWREQFVEMRDLSERLARDLAAVSAVAEGRATPEEAALAADAITRNRPPSPARLVRSA